MDALGGLLTRMPGTGLAFVVAAVAVCGLPPLNGFASEVLVYLGALRARESARFSPRRQPFFAAADACWSAGVGGRPGTERCSRNAASKFFAISAALRPPSL